ncbi:MAG TPA: hypothetical protein PKA06_09520 [Gemmatales bacterium]|nr:hypothetical protein [Gemmatales bacterium]
MLDFHLGCEDQFPKPGRERQDSSHQRAEYLPRQVLALFAALHR